MSSGIKISSKDIKDIFVAANTTKTVEEWSKANCWAISRGLGLCVTKSGAPVDIWRQYVNGDTGNKPVYLTKDEFAAAKEELAKRGIHIDFDKTADSGLVNNQGEDDDKLVSYAEFSHAVKKAVVKANNK